MMRAWSKPCVEHHHAHDESGTMTREDALTCMNAIRIIVQWYFREYLGTTAPLPDLGCPSSVRCDSEVWCATCGEKMSKGTRSYVCETCGRKVLVDSTLAEGEYAPADSTPAESENATADCEAGRGALIGAEMPAWTRRPGCSHNWPEGPAEVYDTFFEADLQTPTGRHVFCLGFGRRHAFGMVRRRGVVFQGCAPRGEPLVEFAGADDFERSCRQVSVIKDRWNKQVPSLGDLPEEYREMPTCPFSSVVTGPNSGREWPRCPLRTTAISCSATRSFEPVTRAVCRSRVDSALLWIQAPAAILAVCRNCSTSFMGDCPKCRLYSLLNWEAS